MGRKTSSTKRPVTLPTVRGVQTSTERPVTLPTVEEEPPVSTVTTDSIAVVSATSHISGSEENPIVVGATPTPPLETVLHTSEVTPPPSPVLTPTRLADIQSELGVDSVLFDNIAQEENLYPIPVIIEGETVTSKKRKSVPEKNKDVPNKKKPKKGVQELWNDYFNQSLEDLSAQATQAGTSYNASGSAYHTVDPRESSTTDLLGTAVSQLFDYNHQCTDPQSGATGTQPSTHSASHTVSAPTCGEEDIGKKKPKRKRGTPVKVNLKLAERNRNANLYTPSSKPIYVSQVPDSWKNPDRVFYVEGEQNCSVEVYKKEPTGVILRRFVGRSFERQIVVGTQALKHLYASIAVILHEHDDIVNQLANGLINTKCFRLALANEQDVHLALTVYFGKVKIHIGTKVYIDMMMKMDSPALQKTTKPEGMVISLALLNDLNTRIGPICMELL